MSLDSLLATTTPSLQDLGTADSFKLPTVSVDKDNTNSTPNSLVDQLLSENTEDEMVMEGVSVDDQTECTSDLPLLDEDFDIKEENESINDEEGDSAVGDDEDDEDDENYEDDEDDDDEDENESNESDGNEEEDEADEEEIADEDGEENMGAVDDIENYDEEDEDFKDIEDEIKEFEGLDEECAEASNSVSDIANSENCASDSCDFQTKKADIDMEATASASEKTPSKPKKRKRKKGDGTKKGEKGEPKKKKSKKRKKAKPNNMRRNIRDIMKGEELDTETVKAQQEEEERKKRLLEMKKELVIQQQTIQAAKAKEEEKDSQLKSLLQTDDSDKNDDIIMLDNSLSEDKKEKAEVIDISSDEDDIEITEDDDNEIESDDVNNGGNHINDELNIPDNEGRVQVNIGHPPEDPDIFLAPQIARCIKCHQIGGVRFLYDNLVESMTRCKSSAGFGCILAHSMGLGKTIQMISFIEIFLRCTNMKTVLLIVPINTLQNWLAEFDIWLPQKPENCDTPEQNIGYRSFKVYLLNDAYKSTATRAKVIGDWFQTGGVLLMGYEMYRLLSSRRGHIADVKKPGRKPANATPAVIDVEEEDKNKTLLGGVHEALINPGPDLIVCDEGHRIKNSHAGISQSLKNIRTRRRVVLTGYPLQNNLLEYWCMVDFVRPNFLGTKTEFSNMFERPVMNGQCVDSTPSDEKLMRYRAHVLHSLLEGFVQRRGHTVLQQALPPKQEYVMLVRMSPIQKVLYQHFIQTQIDTNSGFSSWANHNPLKAFAVCCKIWNHPDILHKLIVQKKIDADNDLDIETGEGRSKKGKSKKASTAAAAASAAGGGFMMNDNKRGDFISYDWAKDLMKDFIPGLMETGGKIQIFFDLVEECLLTGDKMLVFSQSLFTLNLLEEFLSSKKVPRPDVDEYWCKNKNYFRLDGSTGPQDRERMINTFNRDNRFWLFLLSTRAGSLGVNLVGANRVVVLDASWNPCHDCQAICRVYRFGQTKPSYIYRLITDNTMEKKIYDRQINKQGMSDRVVDELNPQNNFSRRHVDNLLHYEAKDDNEIDFSGCEEQYDDPVLVNVLKRQGKWLTRAPFCHESLLIDKKELRLSKKEKRLAKQSYVMEKRLNVSYTRPSYTAFYATPGGTGPRPMGPVTIRRGMTAYPNRPVASVKPIITTPVPMRPKEGKPDLKGNKPGVSVHKIITTTDIMLPGSNVATQSGEISTQNKISAGQQIFIIKTPKGVYIRTNNGKIFAVRAKIPTVTTGVSAVTTGSIAASSTTTTISTPQAIVKRPIVKHINPQIVTSLPSNSRSNKRQPYFSKQVVLTKPPSLGKIKSVDTPNTTDMLASIYSQSKQVNSLIQRQDSTPLSPPPSSKDNEMDILDVVKQQSEKDSALPKSQKVSNSVDSSKASKQRPLQKIAPNLTNFKQGKQPNFYLPPVHYGNSNNNHVSTRTPETEGIRMPSSMDMPSLMDDQMFGLQGKQKSNSFTNTGSPLQSLLVDSQGQSHSEGQMIPGQPSMFHNNETLQSNKLNRPSEGQPIASQSEKVGTIEQPDQQETHSYDQQVPTNHRLNSHNQNINILENNSKSQSKQHSDIQENDTSSLHRIERRNSKSLNDNFLSTLEPQNSSSSPSESLQGMSSLSSPSSSNHNSFQGVNTPESSMFQMTGSNSLQMPDMESNSLQMPNIQKQHEQQGLVPGFPFSPYPFPMPQPLLMQSGISGPQSYMGMQMPGQYGHYGGYMPPSFGQNYQTTRQSGHHYQYDNMSEQSYHHGGNMHHMSDNSYLSSTEQAYLPSNLSHQNYQHSGQNYQSMGHNYQTGMQNMQNFHSGSQEMMSSSGMMGDYGMMGQNLGSWDTGTNSDGNNMNFSENSSMN